MGAAKVKLNFSCKNGQINFDGKLLADLRGFEKVNRLAVVAAQEKDNQLLCVTKTDDSTGKTDAEAVGKALEDWGLKESIIACGFDTTSSNTGIHKGSCVFLQDILQRQLLWLACRHHIMELLVKAADHQVFGDSKSPDVKLFSILKDPSTWNSRNLVDFRLPTIPQAYKNNVDSLLSFINKQLDEENAAEIPRGDYKEFLELAKIFLGGSIDRKNGYTFQLSRPGADHHARWMSKCIYFLKLSLLSLVLAISTELAAEEEGGDHGLLHCFSYLESWFCSPSLLGAAEIDLKLFKRLQKFSKINKKISSATSTVLCRHTWYLTEELIPFSLFNKNLTLEERTTLARKIGFLPPAELQLCNPKLPPITDGSTLTDFPGPRSVLLFNLIGISHKFLINDNWINQPEYSITETALRNLSPLNDSCERALALATLVNGKMTRTESSYQELLVVEAHRKMYALKTKKDLKKFL